MLFLVSKANSLPSGDYRVAQLTTEAAANLIREANASAQLESRIHFASSAKAISALTAIDIRTTSQGGEPYIMAGDKIVEIRLKPGVSGPVGLADLEFWQIELLSDAWPALIREGAK